MKTRSTPLITIVIIFLWSFPAYAQNPEILIPQGTTDFIVQTVLTKAKNNDLIKKEKITFKRIHIVYNLSDDGRTIDSGKRETILVEAGGKERLIEKDNKPVSGGKASNQRFDLMKVFETIMKVDNLTITDIQLIDGRPHYVIKFQPKPNQRGGGGDVEDIILRSEGMMYVDLEKFFIRKLVAKMNKSYSRALGMFNLDRADMEMNQREFEGIVVMESLNLVDKYWAIWRGGDTFEKQTYEYTEYQLVKQE